jgi:DNA segregation ATPase FtsK/SpoIIIE, S-DNA-T family
LPRSIKLDIPNASRSLANLNSGLAQLAKSKVAVPLLIGEDISGQARIVDLAKLPHLLVAGTTNSGKSMALHGFIFGFLSQFNSSQFKLVIVDPKSNLEFGRYQKAPHIYSEIAGDPCSALSTMKNLVNEMQVRFKLLSAAGGSCRDINGYNKQARQNGEQELPRIVVIIDEFAELTLPSKAFEQLLIKIAQKARAVGIHLILATQRPDAEAVNGLIKANVPARVALKTTTPQNSQIILDTRGAEQLMGAGDMLFLDSTGAIERLQGYFVSDKDLDYVVGHYA